MASPTRHSAEARYRLLLELSQKVSRTLDLQEVLAELLEVLRTTIGYDAAGIFVLRRDVPLGDTHDPNLIAGVARVGFGVPRDDDPMLRSGGGITGHVIRTGETVVVPDVRRDDRYVEGRPSTQSEIAVPIVSNERVIGALNLESDRLGAYAGADAELLEFFASVAAISIEKALLHREVVEKQRIEAQLKIARDVQENLLPGAPPRLQGYDIDAINLPTWEISGDCYDYFLLPGGRLAVVIADVSGKGIPAALIMATFRTAIRSELRRGRPLDEVADGANRVLLESIDVSRFVTAVCGVLDPDRGAFEYVNCGHNPPMLLRATGGAEMLQRGGTALGFMIQGFDVETVHLGPGDTLVLYTDGVVEPSDVRGEEFGVARLADVVRRSAHMPAVQIVGRVLDATRQFCDTQHFDDDFTLVVIKHDGTPP